MKNEEERFLKIVVPQDLLSVTIRLLFPITGSLNSKNVPVKWAMVTGMVQINTLLEGKLHARTSKTNQLQPVMLDFPLL